MRYLLIVLALTGLNPAFADEMHIIINGKAIHLDDGNYNESNWGLGLNYDFTPRNNWITFFNASFFKDSNDQTSKYVGGGVKRRYMLDNKKDGWHVDVGVIAFLMTRKDHDDNKPFPGALPFVAIGNDTFTITATYIPEVSPKYKDLFYFQVLVKVAEF